jgi:hypothetical protein
MNIANALTGTDRLHGNPAAAPNGVSGKCCNKSSPASPDIGNISVSLFVIKPFQ